jgi:hypothetical protein
MFDKLIVTIIESVYLIYVFFIYKTQYSVGKAPYESETQSLGSMFVHDTGKYENKICLFGKIMAIIAVILASIRIYILTRFPEYKKNLLIITVVFDALCLTLAYNMNLNSFVYLLPILLGEIYLFI